MDRMVTRPDEALERVPDVARGDRWSHPTRYVPPLGAPADADAPDAMSASAATSAAGGMRRIGYLLSATCAKLVVPVDWSKRHFATWRPRMLIRLCHRNGIHGTICVLSFRSSAA